MDKGLEGIFHNNIWPDTSYDDPAVDKPPAAPSFETKMSEAQTSLRKKIEELMRAREKMIKKEEDE